MASPHSSTNCAGVTSMLENSASPGHESSESVNRSMKSVQDQDRLLPMANISRIMRKGIPQNGKIAKESKEFVQECASEFVSFITSEATAKCLEEKKKTISGDDLLWAMSKAGFEHYIDSLAACLVKYRTFEGEKKAATKGARGSGNVNGGVGGSGIENGDNGAHNEFVTASMQGQE